MIETKVPGKDHLRTKQQFLGDSIHEPNNSSWEIPTKKTKQKQKREEQTQFP